MPLRGSVAKYLITTFSLAWTTQYVAYAVGVPSYCLVAVLALCMYFPMLGAVVARGKFSRVRDVKWAEVLPKVHLVVLVSLLTSVLLTLIVRPPSPSYINTEQCYANVVCLMKSPQLLTLYALLIALTVAPFINVVFAFGEEYGWRGFLYAELKKSIPPLLSAVVTGLFWGVWHAPVILLFGYEYGVRWFWEGAIAFLAITVVWSIPHAWAYEVGGVIGAAYMHGAINAILPAYYIFYKFEPGDLIYSPVGLIGLISAIPMALYCANELKKAH